MISDVSLVTLALRRLAAYVDRALLAAEEDVESASESERYQRHRKYFRRTESTMNSI